MNFGINNLSINPHPIAASCTWLIVTPPTTDATVGGTWTPGTISSPKADLQKDNSTPTLAMAINPATIRSPCSCHQCHKLVFLLWVSAEQFE
jgi:hypothetical protein